MRDEARSSQRVNPGKRAGSPPYDQALMQVPVIAAKLKIRRNYSQKCFLNVRRDDPFHSCKSLNLCAHVAYQNWAFTNVKTVAQETVAIPVWIFGFDTSMWWVFAH